MKTYLKPFFVGILLLLIMLVYWAFSSLLINTSTQIREEFYQVVFYTSIIFSFWINLTIIYIFYRKYTPKSVLGYSLVCAPYVIFLMCMQFIELNIPRMYDLLVLLLGYSLLWFYLNMKSTRNLILITGYLGVISFTYVMVYSSIWYDAKSTSTIDEELGAYNLTIKNRNNQSFRLSSFKGQTVFLDLWASSCGNCIASMPDFEALNKKFKNDSNYKLISLYCPINKEQTYRWFLKYIDQKFDYDIDYYYINYEDFNKLNIRQFPEFLIINKNSNLVYKGQITYLPYISDNIYNKLKKTKESN